MGDPLTEHTQWRDRYDMYEMSHADHRDMSQPPEKRLYSIEIRALMLAFEAWAMDRVLLNSGCHGVKPPGCLPEEGGLEYAVSVSIEPFFYHADIDTRMPDGRICRRSVKFDKIELFYLPPEKRSLRGVVEWFYALLAEKSRLHGPEYIELNNGPTYPEPWDLKLTDVPDARKGDYFLERRSCPPETYDRARREYEKAMKQMEDSNG